MKDIYLFVGKELIAMDNAYYEYLGSREDKGVF